MPTTTDGIPYPSNSDPVDVPGDLQELAEAVVSKKGGSTISASSTAAGLIVAHSGSGAALEVRNTGTGNSLVVEDSANPDSTPFVVDASGRVGIGTSSPSTASPDASLDVYRSTESNLLVRGDAGTQVLVRRSSTDGSGPNLNLDKARGTDASKSVVLSGDTLGRLQFRGYDGSAFQGAADIFVSVDGTPGASDMPGAMIFRTTPDGSATLTERMRITNAGNVGIGTSSPGAILEVSGSTGAIFNSSIANVSQMQFRRINAGNAAVASGDQIGDWMCVGWDGSAYRVATRIRGAVDGGVASADMPGRLMFYTTADGGTTENERMRIDNAGLITGTGTSLGAWTAYTPTVSSGTGAITSYTSSGYYTRIGKIVHAIAYVTITNNGTGASYVNVDVPLAIRNVTPAPVGQGREDGITGNGLQWRGIVGTGVARAYTYNNAYPGATNAVLLLSITYETSA